MYFLYFEFKICCDMLVFKIQTKMFIKYLKYHFKYMHLEMLPITGR